VNGSRRLDIAVVGGGWAGLAAAVEALSLGQRVTLYEMAPQAGGRARSAEHRGRVYDNGQHIMVGAYHDTFELMRRVGVPLEDALLRMPLTLVDPRGRGLRLPAGSPVPSFVRGVLSATHWPWRARLALLRTAAQWRRQGFEARPGTTVAALLATVPATVARECFDPLCVAALNTPADQASATVFLRVLRDALFSGPGSSDLVLPRWPLAQLFPQPAAAHLHGHESAVHLRSRVRAIGAGAGSWRIEADGVAPASFDAVVLACSAAEASRLMRPIAPDWARRAEAVPYQAIVTVYASHADARLAGPMLVLENDAQRPAQFVFDRGALGAQRGELAFVVSGANAWLDKGLDATVRATLEQARDLGTPWSGGLRVEHAVAERRATFACTPGIDRPPATIAPGLVAAGDYVEGPYPATLEGSVRAGRRAAALLTAGNLKTPAQP
jgi:squalene-associated FAD-dependent desaturase